MSRDPLTRMDVDTRWMFTDHARKLQTAHPTTWPTFWCAYQAVLAESWWKGHRVTLADAWLPVLPCSIEDAQAALQAAELIDRAGRVTINAWKKWFEPAFERIERRSAAGKAGAEKRWSEHEKRTAKPMRPHRERNAPRQPATPATPASQTGQNDGIPADAIDAFYRLTVSFPAGKVLTWLEDLIRDFGDAAVSDALAVEVGISDDRRTLLSRTQDRLRAADHEAAKRREAAERAAAAASKAEAETMPDEQRAANLERLRQQMEASGLVPAKRS